MTKDKDRDDALIAEVAEMFPPDTVDVQSRYVIVHQLRASADIQDAQTKRETGWADTSDRACLMRKAADALDALLAKLQPAPKPDRAKVLAWMIEGLFAEAADNPCTCTSDENSCPHCNAWERATKQTRACIVEAIDELRAEWEAERPVIEVPIQVKAWAEGIGSVIPPTDEVREWIKSLDGAKGPAVVVPMSAKMWAESVLNLRGAINATCEREAARFILSLDGAKGGE